MASSPRQKTFLTAWWSLLFLLAFAASAASAQTASPKQQKGSQTQQQPSPFRVVKVEVGSKGEQKGGKFVVEDLRTAFHVPPDKQVVIYFEWEGPPGAHHFQGTWRDSQGKVEAVGNFDYSTPERHFSGYWVLELRPNSPPGLWALEARIDGQLAGIQTFEVTGAPLPPPMPTTAEIYQRAQASSVFIAALDRDDELIRDGSGFFIAPGVVATTLGVIDGGASLQVELPGGSRVVTDKVLAWNREQDWALLGVGGAKVPPLKLAAPKSWKVGDTCYVLSSPTPGARTIQPVAITGTLPGERTSEDFSVSWTGKPMSLGSPVLDTYGRVIGILSGGLALTRDFSGYGQNQDGIIFFSGIQPVVAISQLPSLAGLKQPTTLADMAAQGLLIPPVARDTQAAYGRLCHDYARIGQAALACSGPRTNVFSSRDNLMAVVITWGPNRKWKTTDQVRVYNDDNRLRIQTKRAKIDLKPQVTAFTGWKVPVSTLAPGVYRVDVLLGNTPEWRGYFRIHQ